MWYAIVIAIALLGIGFSLLAWWRERSRRREEFRKRDGEEELKAAAAQSNLAREIPAGLAHYIDATLETLACKDPDRERHSKLVTAFSIAIARAMGISSDQIREVARGVFLRDVGQPDASEGTDLRSEPPTRDRTAVPDQHCFRGYQKLRRIPFLQEAAEIVYSHHEHFDGSGFPRRLKGAEIPLGARIVSVADALDLLTSGYRQHTMRSIDTVRKAIESRSGNDCSFKLQRRSNKSAATNTKNNIEITPFIVKNAAFSLVRSRAETSECS
jgi:HD-GYP domain-containing protein (c-di-GMP phosphodiesterase class II)